ncbi:MAG: FKBP-type peptidyl-prolyl cis-trans isomerase [Bacteroidaceae bacterium]|nr:FKBP-type peptidyl-prolyl cis-trans isomerase [Bacteroidaceae bacterium]
MRNIFYICGLLAVLMAGSCKNEDLNAYDPYTNWEERNTAWFNAIMDTAQAEVARARQACGTAVDANGDSLWEQQTPWRVCKSVLRDKTAGSRTDYIVMRMVNRCPKADRPLYNDTVRVNYRGWTLPTKYRYDGVGDTTYCAIFDQSFYGRFDPYEYDAAVFDRSLAAPSTSAANAYIEGFCTALLNMRKDEMAHVYIPSTLGYGTSGSGSIRGGTTLHFFLHLSAIYPVGTTKPDWK